MKSKCFRPKVCPGLLCMGDADAWCAKGEHYDDKDPSCEFAEARGWVRTAVASHSPVVPLPLRRWLHRAWVSLHLVSPEGKLQPARGQARLRSLKITQELMAKAKAQGWGNYDAEVIDASPREDAAAYPDFSPPMPPLRSSCYRIDAAHRTVANRH